MKDAKVEQLNVSDEFLLDCADSKYQAGDYMGALSMLARRNEMYSPSADAFALAADIYEALELHQLCADCWFRFLDTCNEADFYEGYEGLAVAFMNMGDPVRAALFYRQSFDGGEGEEFSAEELFVEQKRPPLHLVRSDDEEGQYRLLEGVTQMKAGNLEGARDAFRSVSENSSEYPSAAGLAAMCTLLSGEANAEEEAEKECEALYHRFPENVQLLTTYCAVLGARDKKAEAEAIAKNLAALPVTATDDLYRIATALCETGLNEEAYEKLCILKKGKLCYDENVLWFHAVAAQSTGREEEAIESLERFTLLYPRRAVAQYFLEKLRGHRDGGEEVKMRYYYRMPPQLYRTVADYFLNLDKTDEARVDGETFALYFRLAFDEMEGRDTKLQLLAAREAARLHADNLLREVLLNYTAEDLVKVSILHDLTMRAEDDSFGAVVCSRYKEYFTHHLEVGLKKRTAFMKAFADVYTKFILFDENGEANEMKLCAAAEDIYHILAEEGAYACFEERSALSAAIYREARLIGGVRGLDGIVALFEADKAKTQEILNHLI